MGEMERRLGGVVVGLWWFIRERWEVCKCKRMV